MIPTLKQSYRYIPGTTVEVRSLVDLLEFRAQNDTATAAYTFLRDGENEVRQLRYLELDTQARAIAGAIMEQAQAGDRVLLLYPPGLEFLSAFFACAYAGAIAVPAYPPHRNRNLQRLEAILVDARPRLILTTAELLPKIESGFAAAGMLGQVQIMASDGISAKHASDYRRPAIKSSDIAFLQYTSGSTGKPKGVILSHDNLLHNARVVFDAVEHTPTDRYITWLPVFHDMGFMAGVLQPLYGSLPCVQMAPAAFLERPARWLEGISKYRGTTSGAPNFAYDLCVKKAAEIDQSKLDLSSWAVAFNGAEPVRAETIDAFSKTFAASGFRRQAFYPCYGLAEATLMATGSLRSENPLISHFSKKALEKHQVKTHQKGIPESCALVGCGRTLLDQEVVIVDPDSQTLCNAGQVGEIWLTGQSVAQGYWGRISETDETFRAYVKDTGAGPFLRTGDLGFVREGQLFVTGRLKDLLIFRGQNYYPQDIELSVARSHSRFRAGCGAAFSIEVSGEERLVIVQEAEIRREDRLGAAILNARKAISEDHEIAPHAIVLIRTGTIPKTSSGKIQRRACKSAFLANSLQIVEEWREDASACTGSPAGQAGAPVFASLKQQATAEWLLAQISRRTGIPAQQIDLREPITAYGLDSLAAIELAHNMQVIFGLDIQMADLFKSLGIAELLEKSESRDTAVKPRVLPVKGDFPLSYGQQAIWFLHEMAAEKAAYNISRAVRIRSALDQQALKKAFLNVIERHPSLRTTFISREGKPMQRVVAQPSINWRARDVQSWTEEELTRALVEESRTPFDLTEGQLLRIVIYSKSSEEHVLQLTVHHLIVDFWSLRLVLEETGKLYEAQVEGTAAMLPPLTCTYRDFVAWQRELVESPQGEQNWSYWWAQLSGSSSLALALPLDKSRPPVQSFQGASLSFRLNSDTVTRFKSVAAAQRATLFMGMTAAFQAFLHRIAGQPQITIGSPTTGRPSSEFSNLVGYCVNAVALRADFGTNSGFNSLLTTARNTITDTFAHQLYPFPLIVEKLGTARDFSSSPVFQVLLVLQKTSGAYSPALSELAVAEAGTPMKWAGLDLEQVSFDQGIALFDLTLTLAENNTGGITGRWEYNRDLFEPKTMMRWIENFRIMLEGINDNPELPIDELPLLSEPERTMLLSHFNQTWLPFDRTKCVHEHLERVANLNPHRTALTHGALAVNYRTLDSRANQLARHLLSLGVKSGDVIGVCMDRSPELVVALLAVWKAGAAYLPLDSQYPPARLRFMLSEVGARLVLAESACQQVLEGMPQSLLFVDKAQAEISRHTAERSPAKISSEQIAYVIFTSGSTGKPKGVMLLHRSLMAFVTWVRNAFDDDELRGVLASTSICFDLSIFELWATLSCGGTVVLAKDVLHWWESAREGKSFPVKLVNTVPSAMAKLLERGPLPESVSTVNLAGEPLSSTLARDLYANRNVRRVHNLYGPTETTTYSTWVRVPVQGDVTIGAGVGNTRIYVLNKNFQLAPIGVKGELYIAGEGLAQGYWAHADRTAEKFLPDPFSASGGERMYRTGDVAKWRKDGKLQYIGRIDDQVKIRGHRIELGEIESVLGQHEAVQECVAAVREIAGDKQVILYATTKAGAHLGGEEALEYLRKLLPGYLVPAHIVFLTELPRTPNGKIDRRALPDPEQHPPRGKAPQNEIEQLISNIWAETLHRSEVGMDDDFFAVGGHSLLGMQILARVEDVFGVRIPFSVLFQTPTPAAMVKALEQAIRGETNSSRPAWIRSQSKEFPLSPAQRRLWFIEQLEPGTSMYNVPVAIEITGRFDRGAAEQALNQLLDRHESLRTVFSKASGIPKQTVLLQSVQELPFHDLSECNETERVKQLTSLQRAEAETPFDVQTGPLFRYRLLRLHHNQHVLCLNLHHLICDAFSCELLFREFGVLYEAAVRGQSPTLPPASQYSDYVEWQQKWIEQALLDSDLAYWRSQLQDCAVLALPCDRIRGSHTAGKSGVHEFQLSALATTQLKAFAVQQNATLFMVVLAAFKALLARLTSQEDICVGTVVSNRSTRAAETVVGLFSNTLALRDQIDGRDTFCDLLRQVKKTLLEASAHQELPFERLVEELQPDRSLSLSPLFQVMLAYQGKLTQELTVDEGLWRIVQLDNGASKFDVTLMAGESVGRLAGAWQYNRDLFNARTVERWSAAFVRILEAAARNPKALISELPLLSHAERRTVLAFSQEEREHSTQYCIHELFEKQVQLTPENTAINWSGSEISYRQLNQQANQIGWYLRRLGVGAEDRIAICMGRNIRTVATMLAVWKAGAAYIPVDPNYPKGRLDLLLQNSAATLVITDANSSAHLPCNTSKIVSLDEFWADIAAETAEDLGREVSSTQLAYLIHTSGSTGVPKAVMLEHRQALLLLNWAKETFSADELGGVLASTSICFDLSIFELWAPLTSGGMVVLADDVLTWWEESHRNVPSLNVKLVNTVPSAMATLVAHGELLSSVCTVNLAGEPLPRELVDAVYVAGSVKRVNNLYGPTETTTYSTWGHIARGDDVTLGRALPNTRLYVLDHELQLMPIGVTGELYIGGAAVARGYWKQAGLTAERFLPDPYTNNPGNRMYRTGDMVRWRENGELDYVGRTDQQVKIRGYRVELGEFETVLNGCPGIQEAAAVVISNHGAKELAAYVVAKPGAQLEAAIVKDYLRTCLPAYMLPSTITMLSSLPKTPNGKVDRKALPEPDTNQTAQGQTPRTATEQAIARIWTEVLGRPSVGVEEDFFSLGGHSLLAMQIISRAEEHFKVTIPLRQLFLSPTVAGMAAAVESNATPAVPKITRISRNQALSAHTVSGD